MMISKYVARVDVDPATRDQACLPLATHVGAPSGQQVSDGPIGYVSGHAIVHLGEHVDGHLFRVPSYWRADVTLGSFGHGFATPRAARDALSKALRELADKLDAEDVPA